MKELGERIKTRRKEQRLSAEDLAVKLGVKSTNIYKWEKGSIPSNPVEFKKLEDWLNNSENGPKDGQQPPTITTLNYDRLLEMAFEERDKTMAEKEARRQDAEKRAEEIKADKRALENIISEQLSLIRDYLKPIHDKSSAVLDYQHAWVEIYAEVLSNGDQKKKDELIAKMCSIIDGIPVADVKKGKA